MVASIIVSIILILLMGGLAFGAVILNLFDRDEDSGDDKEKGIDPAKQTPPCYEAWIEWADMEAK